MLKKSISAALVVIIIAWVEMAMAPMLAMHIWHAHPNHEMATTMAAHHHHAMPAEHPCCPKITKTEAVAPIEFAAGSPPCQNEHRCCWAQAPQNLPTPVNSGQSHSEEISLEETADLTPAPAQGHIFLEPRVTPGSPPDLLGMILRV